MIYRTHNCEELRIEDIGKVVILSGWIQKLRDLGSLIFIDLRDYYGIIQLTVLKNKLQNTIANIEKEFLIRVHGEVKKRKSINYNLSTGKIEILISKLEILNHSAQLPFTIENKTDGNEENRMKYRYLDIRRAPIKNNLIFRHKISLEIRNFMSKNNFLEIETPILINSTSEGARNFVVPSRILPKKFYHLPQSPQLFKQLLMIGGIDKYFQIVKCFRDEDPRSDRQIEFTQIDCEMSFIEFDDILLFFEHFIKHLFKKMKNIELNTFKKMTYYDVLQIYGTNNPDLRIITKLLQNHIKYLKKDFIIGINIPNYFHLNNSQIEYILQYIKNYNNVIDNVLWIKYLKNKTFFFPKEKWKITLHNKILIQLIKYFELQPEDILFIICGKQNHIMKILPLIQKKIYHIVNINKCNIFKPLWIIDYPLFTWDIEKQKYTSFHHPFTSPKQKDIVLLLNNNITNNLNNILSQSYDLVINGVEIGSGSIRIHNQKLQKKIFQYLGLSNTDIESEFGFFIKSFQYGTPPHGGIAFGLDRLIAVMLGEIDNMKNVIPFPKNNYGQDIMTNSPSFLTAEKIKELHL
ncbi:aspartate--tRNA ligase [Blattabacterium cuenoti]|uniref:aspartate--tRNA ligase n=1 Tax=Blattabacterium cuenoti TaxID=1653831 RepID=UPI00163C4F75|nr:aspartate--tRNA ligase [Blattabacterium cuenoti]